MGGHLDYARRTDEGAKGDRRTSHGNPGIDVAEMRQRLDGREGISKTRDDDWPREQRKAGGAGNTIGLLFDTAELETVFGGCGPDSE
jgi:hypothetical protein